MEQGASLFSRAFFTWVTVNGQTIEELDEISELIDEDKAENVISEYYSLK